MEKREIEQLVRIHVNQKQKIKGKKKFYIAANWKMNMDAKEVRTFMRELCETDIPGHLKLIIFPPFPYVPIVQKMLRYEAAACGAQNVSDKDEGAYTGEVSAAMLADCGCSYTLTGHSERRTYYGETSDIVAKKVSKALENQIRPVICIGETLEERRSGTYKEVLKKQIDTATKECKEKITECMIAYEPVWAIGTNVVPKTDEIKETHQYIYDILTSAVGTAVDKIKILYGGSVNENNVRDIASVPFVDGFLIGGASLKAKSFIHIIKLLSLD